jgi:4,5-DOPA dioxygenase extradiol
MNRATFLQILSLLPFSGYTMKINQLYNLSQTFTATEKMPALFLGHGSPMNAVEENEFVKGFRDVAKSLPTPNAIICISAHWLTKGTAVTAMAMPKTIHDFGGFPPELYQVKYPAAGSPALAEVAQKLLQPTSVTLDDSWGLDHGAWSVIKHLYPDANIPVIQLSIDYTLSGLQHYELAQKLAALRHKGILIIGSGNIVHNLGLVDFKNFNKDNYGFDWAIEAREFVNDKLRNGNYEALINYNKQSKAMQLAIPTPEHFLPLIYTLGLQEKTDKLSLFNDKLLAGSLSMTSVKLA